MAKTILYKWAQTGDTNSVPDATTSTGAPSYQSGWTAASSLPYGSTGALPLQRKDFNGIFSDITGILMEYQGGGFAPYITSTMNGGTPYSYPKNAIVLFTDGNNYINTVASNTSAPNVSGWLPFNGSASMDTSKTVMSDTASKYINYFTGTNTGVLSVKITGLVTATASTVDLGFMEITITQDDRDHSSATNPSSYKFMIKGNMDTGVWYNTQAVLLGTNATTSINVRFTRTATDAYIEIGETTSTWYYTTVEIAHVASYILVGFNPSFTTSIQASLLGTTATDSTIAVFPNAQNGTIANLTYKPTPVSITAWTYSGTTTTTITLTVASHTFVVNDFILVNGLTTSTAVSTANNYIIPNGVYQVTAVTGTTIQYTITTPSALTLTPTVSSATVIGQTAVNGVVGGNRTQYIMTSIKAISTIYYNTSNVEKTINVTVLLSNIGSAYLYVNGIQASCASNGAAGGGYVDISFEIMKGNSYQITTSVGASIYIWTETF